MIENRGYVFLFMVGLVISSIYSSAAQPSLVDVSPPWTESPPAPSQIIYPPSSAPIQINYPPWSSVATPAPSPYNDQLPWTPPPLSPYYDDQLPWTPPAPSPYYSDQLPWIPPSPSPDGDQLPWTPPAPSPYYDDQLPWISPAQSPYNDQFPWTPPAPSPYDDQLPWTPPAPSPYDDQPSSLAPYNVQPPSLSPYNSEPPWTPYNGVAPSPIETPQPPSTAYPPSLAPLPSYKRKVAIIEGVIYCASCRFRGYGLSLKAFPLRGIPTKLLCKDKMKGVTIHGKGLTDHKGYFFIKTHIKKQKGLKSCRVVAKTPAWCSKRIYPRGSKAGFPLHLERIYSSETSQATLFAYTTGFLKFAPTSKRLCPRRS
uniref:Uncharacterized protein n=1 Tax=Zea mays TaxID=4577 RepID=B4FMQ8_MAIZE|nr:unknown [Zea mays]